MKKLVLSLFVVVAAMSFKSAKAQNATGNASDNGVPLTAPAPQVTPGASIAGNAVNTPNVNALTTPPVVTITPATVPTAIATAAPSVPSAPAAPAPPSPGTPPPAASLTTTLNVPLISVPPTVGLPQLPDVRLRINSN